MFIECPICHSNLFIQRVSDDVSCGTTASQFLGLQGGTAFVDGRFVPIQGVSNLIGQPKSSIARFLTPPIKPGLTGYGSWKINIISGLIILFSFLCLGITIGYLYYRGHLVNPSLFDRESNDMRIAVILIGILILVIDGLVLFRIKPWFAEKNEIYQSKKANWEKSLIIWERLYYCLKDDIVFDPENEASFKPIDMKKYLESNSPIG